MPDLLSATPRAGSGNNDTINVYPGRKYDLDTIACAASPPHHPRAHAFAYAHSDRVPSANHWPLSFHVDSVRHCVVTELTYLCTFQ
eukprot:COSAG02_NODE_2129_length_9739_cov_2.068568_3_plen_86_part_00